MLAYVNFGNILEIIPKNFRSFYNKKMILSQNFTLNKYFSNRLLFFDIFSVGKSTILHYNIPTVIILEKYDFKN